MVYRDDSKCLFGITNGDKRVQIPNATWISLALGKANTPTSSPSEEGESRMKKILRTTGKVAFVAVPSVGPVALGALLIMGVSVEEEEEEEEKMMKRPSKMGHISRRKFENNPRGYFHDHLERMKVARSSG